MNQHSDVQQRFREFTRRQRETEATRELQEIGVEVQLFQADQAKKLTEFVSSGLGEIGGRVDTITAHVESLARSSWLLFWATVLLLGATLILVWFTYQLLPK